MTLGTSVHPDPPHPAAIRKERRAICFEGLLFTFSYSLILRDSAPVRRSTIVESILRLDRRISFDTDGRSNYFSSRLSRQSLRPRQSGYSCLKIRICREDAFRLFLGHTMSHFDKTHNWIPSHTRVNDRFLFAQWLKSPRAPASSKTGPAPKYKWRCSEKAACAERISGVDCSKTKAAQTTPWSEQRVIAVLWFRRLLDPDSLS